MTTIELVDTDIDVRDDGSISISVTIPSSYSTMNGALATDMVSSQIAAVVDLTMKRIAKS